MNLPDVFYTIIIFIFGIFTRYQAQQSNSSSELFKLRFKNEAIQGILGRLKESLSTAVQAVMQEYVEGLKKGMQDGVLTPEEKKEAKERALNKAKSYIGATGLEEIKSILGISDLDMFLSDKIEATVHDIKATKNGNKKETVILDTSAQLMKSLSNATLQAVKSDLEAATKPAL